MGKNIKTNFRHKLGQIVISQGIGDLHWGAFIEKDGRPGSLKRFKPIPMDMSSNAVRDSLENYKGKAIWRIEHGVTVFATLKRKGGLFHWVFQCPHCGSMHWANAGPYNGDPTAIIGETYKTRCGNTVEIYESEG